MVICWSRKIIKAGVLPLEREPNRSDRAVPLLTDDDLRGAFVGAVFVIYFIAVNKHDDIRVLLNRT